MSNSMNLETLESRRMLSVSVSNGIVRVRGTEQPDDIQIRQDLRNIYITDNGVKNTLAKSRVSRIIVDTLGGDDIVQASQQVTRRMLVRAGQGADSVTGGAANDQIFGGDNDDLLRGGGGKDKLWGERGDDVVQGNADNDSLWGG
ncbi:MAG: calcium-binding protein, partial [Tepidisphaeraceae bacterium]